MMDGWKEIHQITSDADHERAIARVSELMEAGSLNQSEENEIMLLTLLVERYEETRWPIPTPPPV